VCSSDLITIRKNIIAHTIPRIHGEVFRETDFMDVFRITQWHINKIVITVNTFIISNVPRIFSPSPFINSIEPIIFFAVENSRALKNTQIKLTSV
jgi:hypothetical protein